MADEESLALEKAQVAEQEKISGALAAGRQKQLELARRAPVL